MSLPVTLFADFADLADSTDPPGPLPAIPASSLPSEHPHTLTGDVRMHRNFPSEFLSPRNVLVYLPPGYDTPENKTRRYPVLYLHDGQNCFDGATSFIPGKEWRVDEAAQHLIETGQIEPLIIVAAYNTGVERMNEYTPTKDGRGRGGKADTYGKLLTKELKPFIDSVYRTKRGAEDTALGGSSLGGLVTLHLGLKHSDTFRRLAVLSPSVWWNNKAILKTVNNLGKRPSTRIWLDIGTAEGFSTLPDTRLLRDALFAKGWAIGKDLAYVEADGAEHNEEAWAARFPSILQYLFPVR